MDVSYHSNEKSNYYIGKTKVATAQSMSAQDEAADPSPIPKRKHKTAGERGKTWSTFVSLILTLVYSCQWFCKISIANIHR